MTLTRRLYVRIMPLLILTVGGVGWLTWRSADLEITHIYDAELINYADIQWMRVQHQLMTQAPPSAPVVAQAIDFSLGNQLALNEDADDYGDAHAFRFWKDGQLAYVSENAFPVTVPPFAPGFVNFSYKAVPWRIYTLPIPGSGIVVEVAEMRVLRSGLVSNILWEIAVPLLVLIPVLAVVIWLVIGRGLRTISDLVAQIQKRTPDNLRPLLAEGMPVDLVPVVRSVNQLMTTLDHSLARERSFADLAAHQLRTPQAGTQLLLQMLRNETNPEERKLLEARLFESSERSMHLINQLLHFARVGHQVLLLERTDLRQEMVQSLADFGPVIEARHIDCAIEDALEGMETAPLSTDQFLLRLLLDNLLDNAIKYSPDGGEIRLRLERSAPASKSSWTLMIEDQGPGIAAEKYDVVFRPFFRLPGAARTGAGLGLAIVGSAAARLGVSIALSKPPNGKGLRVTLTFP